jgi:hypothetical protein
MKNDIDKSTEPTFIVTIIDEHIRPKTTYEKVTKVANDWAFIVFLAAIFCLLAVK